MGAFPSVPYKARRGKQEEHRNHDVKGSHRRSSRSLSIHTYTYICRSLSSSAFEIPSMGILRAQLRVNRPTPTWVSLPFLDETSDPHRIHSGLFPLSLWFFLLHSQVTSYSSSTSSHACVCVRMFPAGIRRRHDISADIKGVGVCPKFEKFEVRSGSSSEFGFCNWLLCFMKA
jgi:hypothetical protein